MKISWDPTALEDFAKAMEYIAMDSYKAAVKVAEDIEKAVLKAAQHPLSNPPDKFRMDKDELYRALTVYSFRISYRIDTEELIVVRFRHVRQEPLDY